MLLCYAISCGDKVSGCYKYIINITNKYMLKKKKCDVRLMIDRDVAEKRYENKVGMSS